MKPLASNAWSITASRLMASARNTQGFPARQSLEQ